MTKDSGDRSSYFPAIEKKYGQPIQFWLDALAELGAAKYPQQIALLREDHGFSQTHANAVVMFVRGSTTSKRFTSPDAYLATLPEPHQATTKAILSATLKLNAKFEVVMAWNKPMVRLGKDYIIGLSAAKNHLLMRQKCINNQTCHQSQLNLTRPQSTGHARARGRALGGPDRGADREAARA